MNTSEALQELGVTDALFTAEQRHALDTDGYVILPNLFTPEQC